MGIKRVSFAFLFLLILFHPQMAFSQKGLVKTIRDFEGTVGQHSFTENKLVFIEVNDNGIGDEDLWVYGLESKEIERVSSRLEHYSNSFFVYENFILFNQDQFLVQYDLTSKDLDTLSLETDQFISTDFRNAVRLGNSVFFTEDQELWKLDTESKDLVFIGTQGHIFGNGQEHIYLNYRQNINVFDVKAQESFEVHSAGYNYELTKTAALGDDLLFLYHGGPASEMYLDRYDANLNTTSTLEVPIERVNDDDLYVFHKIDEDRLIFYDKTSYSFWLYDNQQGGVTEIDQLDNEGNALRSYGKFVSNSNEVFFWGNINGIGPSIIKYDLQTSQFTHVVNMPSQYATTRDPLQLFEESRIITQVKTYQTNQRLLIDIDLTANSIDTIAEDPSTTSPIFFQNALIYEMPVQSYGPSELYRYDFSLSRSALIEGSYIPNEDVFTYQYKLIQYNNAMVFMWDNRGTFRTIDDSYIDAFAEDESCDYYVFLGDTLTESGTYRRKADGPTIDTVYTLDFTINTLELGVSRYSTSGGNSYLRAEEQNADTYQWFSCEDKSLIANATSRDFYYSTEGYYGVALTKGSCVDTTGSEDFVYLVSEEKDGDYYQWVNCDDFSPIEGAVNSSFRASFDKEYALIINKGDCQDTTACYSPTILGIDSQQNNAHIYPNPTSEAVKIDIPHFTKNVKISIFNTLGVKLKEYNAEQWREGTPMIVSDKPGVYNICISDNDYFNCQKVVVK